MAELFAVLVFVTDASLFFLVEGCFLFLRFCYCDKMPYPHSFVTVYVMLAIGFMATVCSY